MNDRIRLLAECCFDSIPESSELVDFVRLVIKEYDRAIAYQIQEYRFDEQVHLGLGDVRLTIGMQEEILEKAKHYFGIKE